MTRRAPALLGEMRSGMTFEAPRREGALHLHAIRSRKGVATSAVGGLGAACGQAVGMDRVVETELRRRGRSRGPSDPALHAAIVAHFARGGLG